jgi:hypothetical protein
MDNKQRDPADTVTTSDYGSSSLNMSKMAKLFEAQKPGKNRAKINCFEEFIKET